MKVVQVTTIALGSFGVCFLGTAIVGAIRNSGQGSAPSVSRKGPVNLVEQGHHLQAMQQAQALMNELKAKGWDRFKVNSALLRLPDQDYSEDSLQRRPQSPSFAAGPFSFEFYDAQIAFFCPTYVREVRTYSQTAAEGISSTRLEGFYIVGWKDGRIEQVPVDKVRVLPVMLGGRRVGAYIFPGMKEYDPTLPTRLMPEKRSDPPAMG